MGGKSLYWQMKPIIKNIKFIINEIPAVLGGSGLGQVDSVQDL